MNVRIAANPTIRVELTLAEANSLLQHLYEDVSVVRELAAFLRAEIQRAYAQGEYL